MQQPQRNDRTIEFYNQVKDRCAEIAALPPSQHDAAITALSKETGLTPITIAPIIEKYAHLRLPDYPSLTRSRKLWRIAHHLIQRPKSCLILLFLFWRML